MGEGGIGIVHGKCLGHEKEKDFAGEFSKSAAILIEKHCA